jgi:HD-like signal output (HDOD) protein
MTGLKVKALLCRSEDIRAAVERYYPKDAEAASAPADASTVAAELKLSGVAGLIRGIDALPTLPETVQRVKELTDAPDSSIEEIAAVISNDPPIAARLLQLANSPAYGFESKVGSVERATTLLGLKETFMVVLSSAVIDLTQKSKGFDYESFWDESLATAQICRILAKVHGKRSDGVLSTAGLLAGIGRFALAQAVAKRYAKIDASLRGQELVQAEEEELGIAHPEAGFELATHWGLPEEIAMAIRFHLAPERAGKHQATVATVGLATKLSRLKLGGADSAEDILAREDMTLALADITAAQAVQAYKTLISGE